MKALLGFSLCLCVPLVALTGCGTDANVVQSQESGAGEQFISTYSLGPAAAVPVVPDPLGTGTPGYWKNHLNRWPAVIVIGGTEYTREYAAELMGMPEEGDKTYTLFRALVAAVLNVQVNYNPTDCAGPDGTAVAYAMGMAHGWLTDDNNPVGSGVKARTSDWKAAEPWYELLDAYNNGLLSNDLGPCSSRDSLEDPLQEGN